MAAVEEHSKFTATIELEMSQMHREQLLPGSFAGAMREAVLFDDLLRKVAGDQSVVERLIEYERDQKPNATRLTCLQNAIQRWEQENR